MSSPNPETPDNTTERIWSVYRIDDNGNTFIVQDHLTLEEAVQLLAIFETRGHKQYYWIELEGEESTS